MNRMQSPYTRFVNITEHPVFGFSEQLYEPDDLEA